MIKKITHKQARERSLQIISNKKRRKQQALREELKKAIKERIVSCPYCGRILDGETGEKVADD